jgi:hypothetical protein
MFAMVAISDYTIVGVEIPCASANLKNVYNMSDNKINPVAFLIKAFDDRNYTNSERCEKRK